MLMRNSALLLLLLPVFLAAKSWIPEPLRFPLFPVETVPGLYYFTDRGNFRLAGEISVRAEARAAAKPVFDEAIVDGPAVDFGPRLAFTFDDVHFGLALDRLLDILRDRHVPAIFFLTETHMAGSDEATIRRQLRRMIAEGHELGNHSADHPDLDAPYFIRRGLPATRDAFARLEARVDQILGGHVPIRYLRPPFGVRGNGGQGIGDRMSLPGRVDELCRETGQFIILWQINSLDFLMFANPASREHLDSAGVVDACCSRIAGSRGGVVLFHANDRTPAVVGGVLDRLAGKNAPWLFVNVAELMEIKYGRAWLDAWTLNHRR